MEARFACVGAALALSGSMAAPAAYAAAALDYPVRPVRMIVVFPPGSGTDIAARLMAQELSGQLGKQFVVDNRPGAGGMIGTEAAVNSNPDGHTLVMVSSSFTINPSVYAKVPYDAKKDLAPVTLIGATPYLFAAHPSVPAKTVSQLVALAKSKPGQLNYGAGGVGVGSHLAGELFKSTANVDIVMVPYKGAPQATADVMAGQVQLAFLTFPTGFPLVKSGKLTGLGVTSLKRVPVVPDIPTIAESGLPGFDVETWFGMLAPAGTSKDIVARVYQELIVALKKDQVRDKLTSQGYRVVANTPAEFERLIANEIDKWAKVVKVARIPQIGGTK
ncbi:MAG TPA: tripartite tricarboxylate transporter substrate binding protein [Burkholderiales bacterium]|nr:tripartite tricarboxylate transporter substrate binding protein [Burkholderiales bacterium]